MTYKDKVTNLSWFSQEIFFFNCGFGAKAPAFQEILQSQINRGHLLVTVLVLKLEPPQALGN